jgi:hypothetical protein
VNWNAVAADLLLLAGFGIAALITFLLWTLLLWWQLGPRKGRP